MKKEEPIKIQKYQKRPYFNIGIVIFGAIFIYLIATILMYFTSRHVSAYEVREGSILRDTAYTGLAIRNETIVSSEAGGYVNYFVQEGSKVGAKTDVYSLSEEKLEFRDAEADGTQELSAEEQQALLTKEQSFSENFKDSQFYDVYTLRDTIGAVLESKSSQSRQAQLEEMLKRDPDSLHVYKSSGDGIILYSIDGFETTDPGSVTEKMLSKEGYEVTALNNNAKIRPKDPVYKLITDDNWTLVISLNDETAAELKDKTRIKVRFLKDNETQNADFSIYQTPNGNLGFLSFDTAMIRYAEERYLDIELILEDESGLKIPKSSVVKKDFYTVPADYITQGGNSRESGVLVKGKSGSAEFKPVELYYFDRENNLYYLDPLAFDEDTVLIKPESAETYDLKPTKSLQGVYNINKGYAVFKQIEILCESEEYYIVKAGNDYSLSNYDHIALDGGYVRENDVVF